MEKTIVTHFAPDIDAIASVWLIKRFLPGWSMSQVVFVPAGQTLNGEIVDSNPEILHVDTGLGKLDHHQINEDTCAAKRTLEYISQYKKKKQDQKNFPDEALSRLIDVVNDIDHFREVYFPNPTADFYDFSLVAILDGLKLIYPDDHKHLLEVGLEAFDGLYKTFQNKVWAEKEIKREGIEFQTRWGKAIAVETTNDEVVRLAQKQGFVIALRKDPKKGYIRIKALPDSKVDLSSYYTIYKKMDKDATWFLHASKKMILNGSMKNPQSRPTKLTLREIVAVLKKK